MRRVLGLFVFVLLSWYLASTATALGQTVSSYSLRNDATGGDCTLIGTWDAATKTCSLTSDLYYAQIYIMDDYITLDGNGNALIGNGHSMTAGVHLSHVSGATLTGLEISGYPIGISSHGGSHNIIYGNTLGSNETGILLDTAYDYYRDIIYNSEYNLILNNNFVDNAVGAVVHPKYDGTPAAGNLFTVPLPYGGNYWSDYDSPAEGCDDTGGDGFCDEPYTFTGGQDDLPLAGGPIEPVCHDPGLSLRIEGSYWGSLIDFDNRLLSVDYAVDSVTAVDSVNLRTSVATNGVVVWGKDPFPEPGQSPYAIIDLTEGNLDGSFTHYYIVPMGVASFKATIYVNGRTVCGERFEKPGPYPPT